jgi:hypothetical protein
LGLAFLAAVDVAVASNLVTASRWGADRRAGSGSAREARAGLPLLLGVLGE